MSETGEYNTSGGAGKEYLPAVTPGGGRQKEAAAAAAAAAAPTRQRTRVTPRRGTVIKKVIADLVGSSSPKS
ncbi:hypothetical protein CDL12_06461 [Handroanthus impetiginosus]|uniref:Uncharacterized protein n=1 Tax=Handroanthus impetiginosus TaxID=429701 RepID=A0A2G9HTK7_9LAMI|nr:hypothetical protein CDL12_06461 [Handroanthus impetiginosus]